MPAELVHTKCSSRTIYRIRARRDAGQKEMGSIEKPAYVRFPSKGDNSAAAVQLNILRSNHQYSLSRGLNSHSLLHVFQYLSTIQ